MKINIYTLTQEFLLGANSIDDHFRNMPLENNLPVLLGLMSVWNVSFLGYPARAILPYCQVCVHVCMQSRARANLFWRALLWSILGPSLRVRHCNHEIALLLCAHIFCIRV